MANVTLTIGERTHQIACRDGEEARLATLAGMINARWADAERASGGFGGERTMLIAALMLADSLDEAETQLREARDTATLDTLADRLERLADALEKPVSNA